MESLADPSPPFERLLLERATRLLVLPRESRDRPPPRRVRIVARGIREIVRRREQGETRGAQLGHRTGEIDGHLAGDPRIARAEGTEVQREDSPVRVVGGVVVVEKDFPSAEPAARRGETGSRDRAGSDLRPGPDDPDPGRERADLPQECVPVGVILAEVAIAVGRGAEPEAVAGLHRAVEAAGEIEMRGGCDEPVAADIAQVRELRGLIVEGEDEVVDPRVPSQESEEAADAPLLFDAREDERSAGVRDGVHGHGDPDAAFAAPARHLDELGMKEGPRGASRASTVPLPAIDPERVVARLLDAEPDVRGPRPSGRSPNSPCDGKAALLARSAALFGGAGGEGAARRKTVEARRFDERSSRDERRDQHSMGGCSAAEWKAQSQEASAERLESEETRTSSRTY
jgi:hypothetical protein